MQQPDNGQGQSPATSKGRPASADDEASNIGSQTVAGLPDALSDDEVIRLAVEALTVDKRLIETGRVRVHRSTKSRVERVDIALSSHTVEVRRVRIDKPVKELPSVRATRKEIIIPVVEEVLVIEKRLILREEVHVRKKESVRRHVEDVTLRGQEATVERLAPEDSEPGTSRAERSERPPGTGRPSKQPRKKEKKRSGL